MPFPGTSLLLGARNPGKIHESKLILGDLPLEFYSLNDFSHVAVAIEDEDTYAGNAIAKARFYSAKTGIHALADDSGLEVESLDGAPGVISARYAGAHATGADRRQLLLSALAQAGPANRRARFACASAFGSAAGDGLDPPRSGGEGSITFVLFGR